MSNHPTTPAPYGGYTLVGLREAGGDETVRFEATVAKDGKKLFHVSNGGTGGSHRYGGLGPHRDDAAAERGWRDSQAAIAEFADYAQGWNLDSPYSGWGDDDQLVDRLISVARLNRMRRTPLVLDGEDPWESGDIHVAPASMSREQVVEMLRSPEYAGRSPRVWDKAAGDFVPVT